MVNREFAARAMFENYKDWKQGSSWVCEGQHKEGMQESSRDRISGNMSSTPYDYEQMQDHREQNPPIRQPDLSNKLQHLRGALLHSVSDIKAILEAQGRNAEDFLTYIETFTTTTTTTSQQRNILSQNKKSKRASAAKLKSQSRTIHLSPKRVAQFL